MFKQHGGNTRFVWNLFLQLNKQEYEKSGKFLWQSDLCTMLPSLKKEHDFLKLGDAQSLQQVARHFNLALEAFLDPKRDNEFPVPKFKSEQKDGFVFPQRFKIYKNSIHLPKIGKVKWIKDRPIKGKPKRIIIKQDGNQWFCCVQVEINAKDKPITEVSPDKMVGIDVGIKTYATNSDGSTFENPKFMRKWEKKLKRTQRQLSRKKKGSKNREKQRNKLNQVHRKIRRARKDFQDKVTSQMIAKYDVIFIENLNVKGMMSNHCLAKVVQDCAWYQFKSILIYKAKWAGKLVIEIDRWEPTSKCCSNCGWKDVGLTLKDRVFKCEKCGLVIDRDLNAAINIRNVGEKLLRGTQEVVLINGTLVENKGFRILSKDGIQCCSLKQEQKRASPDLCGSDCLNQ